MHTISVLMPAYNCAKYVEQAINSILSQSLTEFELVIVNDGSTDNTNEIISKFSDSRIRYYQNSSNEGLNNVRNRLVALSKGDFIAFLDSDDIAEKNRLEIQHSVLSANSEITLVAGSVKSIDENGYEDFKSWKFDLEPVKLKAHLLFYNPIVTSAVMFKREKLPAEIFRVGYPPCEDYDLWVRMLLNSKGVVLPEFLATYRLYHNSVSKRKADDARNNRNKVIVDQLEYYFPNKYTEEEKTIHLSLVEFSLKNKIDDLAALTQWIHKLIALNQQQHHFDERILKQLLYERILKKFLRLADYDYSVFKTLMQLKKDLQPDLTFELRKKEIAILAFSVAHKKFITLN